MDMRIGLCAGSVSATRSLCMAACWLWRRLCCPLASLQAGDPTPGRHRQCGWLGLLTVSVGAPFFAVSATAPLIQRWFARTGHPHAHDPYFLYSASNLGSVLALLAFPFVLEPTLSSNDQSIVWSIGFGVLTVCIIGCGVLVWRRTDAASIPPWPHATVRPNWRQRATWMVYAAVPSALLLGVTTHISTDIAAAPLLWVVPLTLYLLTFAIAFARHPLIPHWLAVRAMPLALMVLVALFVWREPIGVFLPLHLLVFFVIALMCHGELVRHRPDVESLTEFYLFLSLGGVMGGAFVALCAPVLFNTVFEYPLSLTLAAALLPSATPRANRADVILALVILAVLVGGKIAASGLGWQPHTFVVPSICAVFALVVFARQTRPFGFALCVGVLLVSSAYALTSSEVLWRGRSFFGVYRISRVWQPY